MIKYSKTKKPHVTLNYAVNNSKENYIYNKKKINDIQR